MLIPIGTDAPTRRKPVVTIALVAINLAVFLAQSLGTRSGLSQQLLYSGGLVATDFHIANLFTYQFLHGDWWHVLGNMIFLWPFGRAVEDRIGHVGFAALFLGCGAIAGVGHVLFSAAPVIGASGSVCAVTAAFVALAPRTHVRVLLVFFIIGIYSIPSLWLVGLYIAFDAMSLLGDVGGNTGGGVAWVAHLAGYGSGFAMAMGLLMTGIVPRGDFDIYRMISQARRRAAYRRTVRSAPPSRVAAEGSDVASGVLRAPQPKVADSVSQGRVAVARLVAAGDVEAATTRYLALLEQDQQLALDARSQVVMGNWLMRNDRVEDACRVYELHLESHPRAEDVADVTLLLCAKYVRHLHRYDRAIELLDQLGDTGEERKRLVDALRAEIPSDEEAAS